MGCSQLFIVIQPLGGGEGNFPPSTYSVKGKYSGKNELNFPQSTNGKNKHLLKLISLMTVIENREELNKYINKRDVIFTYLPHLQGKILIGR